jgi:hypothetical protein
LYDSYNGGAKLAAVLYLHNISDNRMTGSAMEHLELFSSMCGQAAMQNVAIVTTMWSYVPKEVGNKREEDLKREVWNDMLANGCCVKRFENTYDSAWSIVGSLTQQEPDLTLLIQKEMGDDGKLFNETKAGMVLNSAADATFRRLLRRFLGGCLR